MTWRIAKLFSLGAALAVCGCNRPQTVRVGSKLDTESVTLGAMASELATAAGADVQFRKQLNGTRVAWAALLSGDIDIYPEYTGTIAQEILAGSGVRSIDQIREALRARGVSMTAPLGFNNTYAIGMRDAEAQRLAIRAISDLRNHPELRLGFSNEFMNRADGWPGLKSRYQLPQQDVRGLEHTLAYQALQNGSIAATDLYSTDAEIRLLHLRVLEDDLHYFPDYQALFLYRSDLATRAPAAVRALERLSGKISESEMVQMNARTKHEHVPNEQVAAEFLRRKLGLTVQTGRHTVATDILRWTVEHLQLVSVSLLAAMVLGLPLGVVAAKVPPAGRIILAVVAVIYTIPSLALLVFLIPLLGIGAVPAMVALFLYSLLPIVRNTHAGLNGIAPSLRESAEALGLPGATRLRRIELPLAAGSILAGIKTAAVINVGTATLGALISAGGYGQPILTGITQFDIPMILEGAIPAAVMALAVQGFFELAERRLIPAGLRTRTRSI